MKVNHVIVLYYLVLSKAPFTFDCIMTFTLYFYKKARAQITHKGSFHGQVT